MTAENKPEQVVKILGAEVTLHRGSDTAERSRFIQKAISEILNPMMVKARRAGIGPSGAPLSELTIPPQSH